ncbi:MAG: L-aspartate oxidase [Brumimicrobium sp.]|nr:L-aspartate oxidase [Brumimicrobium sp.]
MQNKFDILIIGSGIAGLSQAITLVEKDASLKIGVISKSEVSITNTSLAQGGIAAVMSTEKDSYQAHIDDTIKASQNKADIQTVTHIVEHAHEGIHQLEKWGVEFDKENGEYHFGLEGGHSAPRVLHVKDQTGAAVHKQLLQKASSLQNITILEDCEAIELLLNTDKSVGGASVYNYQDQTIQEIQAKIVVLATGGMGQLFEYTTNSAIATGDGILLAHQAGATIENIQAIQFHPTAFKQEGKNQLFLITEAMRGAGAYIINDEGKRFVFDYDERGELATRDIVSKAIYSEMKRSGSQQVYLDCRHISKEILLQEFPFIYDYCKAAGIDLSQQIAPIVPAAHYSCGGIKVDIEGKTTVQNLYAIGECTNTGLHGNNRLASNSLLEAIVLAADVTKSILSHIGNVQYNDMLPASITEFDNTKLDLTEDEIKQLKKLLSTYFITNSGQDLYEIKQFLTVYFSYVKGLHGNSLEKLHFQNKLILSHMLIEDRAGEKVRVEL